MMGRALRITEAGLKRAIEVLKASKPGSGKRLGWKGKTLTSELLCGQKLIPQFCAQAAFRPARSLPEAIRLAIPTSAAMARYMRIH